MALRPAALLATRVVQGWSEPERRLYAARTVTCGACLFVAASGGERGGWGGCSTPSACSCEAGASLISAAPGRAGPPASMGHDRVCRV